MTNGRTYLSIGDVLTLLRQEFPDVTISKIRFLESQGLVNPERTPSGYRKFYDHDVERLKWVLSQQREHFLPLKVIKGRLEDETTGGDTRQSRGSARTGTATRPAASVGSSGRPGGRSDTGGNGRLGGSGVGTGVATGGASGGGRHAAGTSGTTTSRTSRVIGLDSRAGEVPGKLPGFDRSDGDDRRGAADGGRKTRSETVGASTGTSGSGVARPDARAGVPDRRGLHGAGGGATTTVDPGRHVSGRTGHPSEGPPRADATGEGRTGAPRPGGPGATTSEARSFLRTASGSLTATELAAASGLSQAAIEELEAYGILGGRAIGGVVHYDESEVVVAELAAEFAQFGIEPRHLRLYKHASEREAGFVEQLVLPLLKQRNPEARIRAAEMVADLTRLGQGLREALVRRNLKDLLGG